MSHCQHREEPLPFSLTRTEGGNRKVLNMAQIHYIKDLYENEDLSLREIARRTQHSFTTVQKYAYQEDWSEDTLPNVAPEDYPILGAYIPYINEWMEADRKVPRKQRHTARRISSQTVLPSPNRMLPSAKK